MSQSKNCPKCNQPMPKAEEHAYNGICENCYNGFTNSIPPSTGGSARSTHGNSKRVVQRRRKGLGES